MVIDKVYSIWSDLEKSYKSMGKGESRLMFLQRLAGYVSDNNTTKLDSLKTAIAADSSRNPSEYEFLVKIFNALSALDFGDLPEISDLDDFVKSLSERHLDKSSGFIIPELPADFFYNLNPFRKVELSHQLGWKTLAISTDFVSDVFQSNGQMINYSLVDPFADEDVVIFKSGDSTSTFISRLQKSNSEFLRKVLLIVQSLMGSGKFPTYCIFVGQKYFTVNRKRAKLNFDLNTSFEGREEIGELACYVLNHKNSLLATPIYCVE